MDYWELVSLVQEKYCSEMCDNACGCQQYFDKWKCRTLQAEINEAINEAISDKKEKGTDDGSEISITNTKTKMRYRFEAYFYSPGYFNEHYEFVNCDETDYVEDEIVDSLDDALDLADRYMEEHKIEDRMNAISYEWSDDPDLTWKEAQEKHIVYAKRTEGPDAYYIRIYEKHLK